MWSEKSRGPDEADTGFQNNTDGELSWLGQLHRRRSLCVTGRDWVN